MPIAFLLLNVELGDEDEVLKVVREIQGVVEVHRVYGVYDTVVKVEADTTERLKKLVTEKIRRIPKVRSTLTMIAIE